MSKRRRGFPSATHVKRGRRSAQGKEFLERLGNNDPCPCGSGRRFQALLQEFGALLTEQAGTSTSGDRGWGSARRSAQESPQPAGLKDQLSWVCPFDSPLT
jgi:SEC-C motif